MAALNSDRDFTLSDLQTPTAIKALVLTAADGKPPFVYYEVGQRPGGSGGEVSGGGGPIIGSRVVRGLGAL